MNRPYEIYQNPEGQSLSVPAGFSWPAVVGGPVWAVLNKLWVPAAICLIVLGVTFGVLHTFHAAGFSYAIAWIITGVLLGFQARHFRAYAAEGGGYSFRCTIPARNGATAIAKLAQVGGEPLLEWRGRRFLTLPDFTPKSLRRIGAVAWLTLKAAFRYKLVLVLIALLLAAVFVLPGIIEHDGTAQGFTQIVLTYTLGAVIGLLGITTLWLACGTLARDIEDCQMHVVMTKPIARWEIWIGKWVGILVLDFGLLAISGATIYGLLLGRAAQLTPEQQAILRSEVLVARASAREAVPDLEPQIQQVLAERLKQGTVAAMDRQFVRKQVEEQVKAANQIVQSGHYRQWVIDLGPGAKARLKDQPMHLRVKFFAATFDGSEKTYQLKWIVGARDSRERLTVENDIAAEAPIEFAIPPNMVGDDNKLTIDCQNWNQIALLFPLEDGLFVLYREGGFTLNFLRGLLILFFWLALLAAIGLACSSRMSFAVSSFVSLAMLIIAFSGGTIRGVIEQGGILEVDHDTGMVKERNVINVIAVEFFKGARDLIGVAQNFSPVDALSSGKSITWGELARAFFQIVVLMGGVFVALGIVVLTRREIALPT